MSVMCPIGCGEKLDGSDVQFHMVTKCPRIPILCPYGCNQTFRRSELATHESACTMFDQWRHQYNMHQGQVLPNEVTFNGIDQAWRTISRIFKPRSINQNVEAQAPPAGAPPSAVPPRLKDSNKGGSGSPGSNRKRTDSDPFARVGSPPELPPPLQSAGEPLPPDGTFLFQLVMPLAESYAPAAAPYVQQAQRTYERFRDTDQKSFWLTHALLGLVLLYFLSSMLLFAFKLFVFTILMYSTGWTVYTSELLHNETVRKYAYFGTALLGLYLFALLN